MQSTEQGNHWISFDGEDAGYDKLDKLKLIKDGEGGCSIEIEGECSGNATMNLTAGQLEILTHFLQVW